MGVTNRTLYAWLRKYQLPNPGDTQTANKESQTKRKNISKHTDLEDKYANLLRSFKSVLNVEGKPFGQLNKPFFCISDGNNGIQWDLRVSTDTEVIHLGVNLEGKKYKSWPIATFIQSEMNDPQIVKIRATLNNPEDVYIRFARDAWQVSYRRTIIEKYLGGKEYTFAEIDPDQWVLMLTEALKCLDEDAKGYRRAKQTMTTCENKPKNGEQVRRPMRVSPRLTIWSSISSDGDLKDNIKNKIAELKPVYGWVARAVSHEIIT